jgi:hypothetical protein
MVICHFRTNIVKNNENVLLLFKISVKRYFLVHGSNGKTGSLPERRKKLGHPNYSEVIYVLRPEYY